MPSQKLIVLGLFEGESFPTPKTHNEYVYVKARLDDVWLETEAVKAESNPDLNTELVWDMTKAQLKALRTKKAPIKVEVWQSEDKLGYLVLDLRNALPCQEGQQSVVNKMKLLGSKHKPIPSLQISLSMEDVPGDDEDDSATESLSLSAKGSVLKTKHNEVSAELTPVLDEEKGYFRIGSETRNQQKFSFSVCIVFARHLDLLLPDDIVVDTNEPLYFQYDLLGNDISTAPFKGLAEPDFKSEKATALIKSTATAMEQFFKERGNLSVKLVCGSCILGEANLDLSEVMPVKAEIILSSPFAYEGRIAVVSAHNFRITKNSDGDFPQIGIDVVFRKEDATITPDASKDITGMDVETTQDNLELTEGQLSSSETPHSPIPPESPKDDIKSQENDESVVDLTDSPIKLPEQLSFNIPKSPTSMTASPPVRLPASPREKHYRSVSVNLFPDDIIYLSPPKQPRLTPPPEPSWTHSLAQTTIQSPPVIKPQVFAPDTNSESIANTSRFSGVQLKSGQSKNDPVLCYKWTVDLKRIVMNGDFKALSLTYKYRKFSRKRISSSPGFSVTKCIVTDIPNGFCEFGFAVAEAELKSTLAKHFLEINVVEDGVVTVGMATIDQSTVFSVNVFKGERVYKGLANIEHMGVVVGRLYYHLVVGTVNPVKPPELQPSGVGQREVQGGAKMEVHVPAVLMDPALRAKMTAEAARELELWKLEQMKEFNEMKKQYHENLVKERQQHLTTLGEEWKEREMAREMELQQKQETVEELKKEFQEAVEKIDVEKEEIKKQKVELEEESRNLREEKGQAMEKLKAKLKSAESEIGKQAVEFEILKKKTSSLEVELGRLDNENGEYRRREVETTGHLAKLRAEKTTWQARIDQSEKAKEFYKKAWQTIKTEVDDLRSEKEKMYLDKIERLESEASELRKKVTSSELLQSELSHLKRQYNACKTENRHPNTAIQRDSVFEDFSVGEYVLDKQSIIDTELSGFEKERRNNRVVNKNGTKVREVSSSVRQSGITLTEDGLKLKQRGTSCGDEFLKLKQRNREDIAKLTQTRSVQSAGTDNSNKMTKQLSFDGKMERNGSGCLPCLEDEITIMKPGSSNSIENSDMTRMRPGTKTDGGKMTRRDGSMDDFGMTTSSPQTTRKNKRSWGGGVAMPVLDGRTQLQKIIDEKDMLLRTGVYTENDYQVSRLTKRIIQIQQSSNSQ